jgi:hypothetical protein
MLEISEALQQLIDRTTNQVVHEAKAQESASAVSIEGDYMKRDTNGVALWKITWDTK